MLEPTIGEVKTELEEALRIHSWNELVFCGFGEPTKRLDILLEAAREARKHYGRQLKIRLDTNGHGYALNPGRDVVSELKAAGAEKLSVSLNAENSETYQEICKPTFSGAYEAVLDFVLKAKSLLEVEVTAVKLPEVDLAKVQSVADSLGVKLRVRDYIPCFY